MSKFFLFSMAAASIALFCGCVNIEYLGDKFPETENVRIYFNLADMPAGMTKIGEATATLSDQFDFLVSDDAVSERLRSRAQKVGADAIFIDGNQRVVTATHTSSSFGNNISSGSVSGNSSSSRYNSTARVVRASFYKRVR